ncbi:DUF2889 domain-containing protein [Herbaspirillum sp. RTI4]|uniref:DUF2889 domain-containing protein n=1 Tax=Herbaspirillum sp. RTI4 TaxID=3048640 RepID=UPI002AB3E15C|nr:DUF2889 domain-containing protein [Herbaspirillum sp. RTI4]MDY7578149.1 DUF2889 domain-containing protein [Herbaspirillum sp. RTI4]MEA9980738.1 DUF2889 domain-containing protein [Herbaspirillum sp. RTI4]
MPAPDLQENAPPLDLAQAGAATPACERKLIHTRIIRIDGYERSDGLWDIEANINDTKQVDHDVFHSIRPAGSAVHDMNLHMTINSQRMIVEAQAVSNAVPYPGTCDKIAPAYAALKGLQIGPGFNARASELFRGINGCTHISEMIGRMASVAMQTMSGRTVQDPTRKPFQLDGCHALATNGELVAQYHPRWYVKP